MNGVLLNPGTASTKRRLGRPLTPENSNAIPVVIETILTPHSGLYGIDLDA